MRKHTEADAWNEGYRQNEQPDRCGPLWKHPVPRPEAQDDASDGIYSDPRHQADARHDFPGR